MTRKCEIYIKTHRITKSADVLDNEIKDIFKDIEN